MPIKGAAFSTFACIFFLFCGSSGQSYHHRKTSEGKPSLLQRILLVWHLHSCLNCFLLIFSPGDTWPVLRIQGCESLGHSFCVVFSLLSSSFLLLHPFCYWTWDLLCYTLSGDTLYLHFFCLSYVFCWFLGMGFRLVWDRTEQHLWESSRMKKKISVALSDIHVIHMARSMVQVVTASLHCRYYYLLGCLKTTPGHGSGVMSVFMFFCLF